MDEFVVDKVKSYEEKIVSMIQKILYKIEVRRVQILLDHTVTNKTQAGICSKVSKKLNKLDLAINKVYLYFVIQK